MAAIREGDDDELHAAMKRMHLIIVAFVIGLITGHTTECLRSTCKVGKANPSSQVELAGGSRRETEEDYEAQQKPRVAEEKQGVKEDAMTARAMME